MQQGQRPSIDAFTCYRQFMREMLAWLRESHGATYRSLSAAAGFSTSSFLKHVLEGERNLGSDSVPRVAAALELSAREARLFDCMVRFGQASSDEDRRRLWGELSRIRQHPGAGIAQAQYEAYAKWYPMVLRELMGLPDFREDPSWLARRLRPKIRAREAAAALRLLEETGLAVRKDGHLEQADPVITTGEAVTGLMVRTFHAKMLELAVEALDGLPREERNITGVMLPLTRTEYEELCETIARFRSDVLARNAEQQAHAGGDEIRHVYELVFSLVPLSQEVREKKK